ncbi:Fructosamine kinase-domain-containing protein [Lasiosphaeria ovina]|uniref:protein-ribulosamine 3-kinase n=1 Tax=Lasiosphaeria ovina TaxID=92902 RepID=A0AAE0TWN0_9PEZI|nr:Fructosamine kinase-domain-containing protein [Lasiosphaeria ovina]
MENLKPNADKTVWDRELSVPSRLIEYVDQGVRAKLPPGTQVRGIAPSGNSYWARTAKIDAVDAAGNATPFFLKVHQFEHGRDMAETEFESMRLMHDVMPEFVMRPLAWGAFAEEPDAFFLLVPFYDLCRKSIKPPEYVALVAELHRRGAVPGGKFGLPFHTYAGRIRQDFPVRATWEQCFLDGMVLLFDAEEEAQGADEELTRLRQSIFATVIPRLLRPLETEGHRLVPTLCHGDLWFGNAAVDTETGRTMIFDAAPVYAPAEYDLGPWFAHRELLGYDYVAEYVKHVPRLEPADEFKDRLNLYWV